MRVDATCNPSSVGELNEAPVQVSISDIRPNGVHTMLAKLTITEATALDERLKNAIEVAKAGEKAWRQGA